MTMASLPEAVTLKEFCPLYSILNAIPAKVQKGFRSVLVYLTALDANGDYIAVGSSIGMLYLYCRHTNQMRKYNLEGKTESISVVKLLSCFDDLVAVGMVSGRVAVFQLVSPLPGRNKQVPVSDQMRLTDMQLLYVLHSRRPWRLRRFDVLGVHKSSITALAWSPNGMKLFSGDNRGKIIQSDLNFDKGSCNSCLILEEMSSIVQLDYSHKVLLISTTQRCLLFYTEEKAVKQVGNQPRKSNGRYGACFIPGLCKQSDLTLFASRPGLRLWKADVHGSVHSTFLLKDVLSQTSETIELYPRVEVSNGGKFMLPEKHLGHLSCFLHEGWVLSWDEYSIYVMDTINQAVIGGLESSGDIVSVSCTNNEIFLLKGDREIIRISDVPEGSVSAVIHSPFGSYTAISAVKGNNQNGTLSDDNENSKDVEKIKTEKIQLCVDDGENALELLTESRNRSWSLTDDVISRRSSMNSVDSGCSLNAAGEQMGFANELKEQRPISQRFSTISNDDFDQELIVKSIKVKKKKKKRPENGFKSLESGSLYRTPSTDSPLTVSSDCFSASESLPGGSAEHLSSQESLLSGKPQSIIDDSCLDVFNTLQLTEPAALVPLDETEQIDNNSRRLLDIAKQYELIIPPVTLSTINPETTNLLQPEESVSYKSTNVSTDAERVYIHDQPALEEYADNKRTLDNYDLSTGIESHITSREEDQMSLEFKKDSNEGVIEDPLLQESCTKCQLSSSFIGEDKLRENFNSWDSKKATKVWKTERDKQDHMVASSDDEDIYVRRLPYSSSDTSVAEMGELVSSQDINSFSLEESALLKSEQLSESWMVYSGPGNGIFALAVSEKYIWCLDYKGSLYCSALPGAGLRWQKFEDAVQQVAVSPSGALLWKIEHKSNKAFACGKVTIKGKRHWYEALPQAAFVALSDDTAWIIRTNGDLYLQTGLSVDRPCARAVKVDCPCPLSQITARNNVVWALTEQRGLLYMEGVSSLSPEGEVWKCDLVSERQALEPVCVTLGDQETVWTLDSSGNLWFRTGVTPKKPQGEDEHWWQVSITDYVVFDHYTLFQTLIQATQTVATVAQAPVEKVADKLRMTFWSQQSQCQPSLLGVNSSGVWITSGKNEFHVAKGNLIGTFWQNFVPRGTASTTKWASVSASASPTAEGCVLWICQSRKDLFCLNDLNPPYRPSTVQLPPETEIVHLSACSDAVWALDHHGGVYIRTLSKTCLTGMHWTKLDLSQLGHVKLCSFSCGNQHIWACDTSGIVYFRVGTQPLNPSMMLPAWIMIEPPIQPVGFNLVAVYSSPNDHMLWTLDNKYNVYVRIGITEEMPVGIDWEHVPGLQACQLAVSARTVWARCPNGDIARRYGITEKNAAGDYWKKIPGNVTWLTVTAMDELWAVGSTGQLLQRLTKTYSHYSNIPKNDSLLVHSDFEDEWEVI